jgi:hypothetical protein
LNFIVDWVPDTEKIEKVYNEIYKSNKHIDSSFVVNFRSFKLQEMTFIERTKNLRFPEINEVSIFIEKNTSKEIYRNLIEFLNFTRPRKVNEFFFGNDKLVNIELLSSKFVNSPIREDINFIECPLFEPLINYIKQVTIRVYLQRISMDADQLKQIFEASRNALELDIIKCEVDIDDSFYLNS